MAIFSHTFRAAFARNQKIFSTFFWTTKNARQTQSHFFQKRGLTFAKAFFLALTPSGVLRTFPFYGRADLPFAALSAPPTCCPGFYSVFISSQLCSINLIEISRFFRIFFLLKITARHLIHVRRNTPLSSAYPDNFCPQFGQYILTSSIPFSPSSLKSEHLFVPFYYTLSYSACQVFGRIYKKLFVFRRASLIGFVCGVKAQKKSYISKSVCRQRFFSLFAPLSLDAAPLPICGGAVERRKYPQRGKENQYGKFFAGTSHIPLMFPSCS